MNTNLGLRPEFLPRVSIIISHRNQRDLLEKALESLSKLNYPKYEIIVVDAASTDGSLDLVESLFPHVRLVRCSHIGIGQAINEGIKRASGEVIVFDFNADELADENWLLIATTVLLKSPKVGVVGGTRIIRGTDDVIDQSGGRIGFLGLPLAIDSCQSYSDCRKSPREVDFVPTPIFKKELLAQTGLVDENFEFYWEDIDFCMRVKYLGYKVLNLPEAVTYHLAADTKKEVEMAKRGRVYYSKRGLIRYVIKHFPLPRLLLALFWWFMVQPAVDAAAFFPLTRSLLERVGVHRKTLADVYADFQAAAWNIHNIRDTLAARARMLSKKPRAPARKLS